VVQPEVRPHYTLNELLAQCDASAEPTAEDREWLDDPAAARQSSYIDT
jgi:antitoxin ChpS